MAQKKDKATQGAFVAPVPGGEKMTQEQKMARRLSMLLGGK